MKLDTERREEILAQLLATYRQELAQLTDDEILSHWEVQRHMENMTEQDWQEIRV